MRIVTFQTETKEARWNDCTFASGAMAAEFWWDKTIAYEQLRILSGKPANHDGATHDDLTTAFKRAGLPVGQCLTSPGTVRLSVRAVQERMKDWSGACIAVNYGLLPRHFSRWDRRFANRKGSHQVFIAGYDTTNDTTWLMDPLGRGNYIGEAIKWADIAKAILRWNGYVYAMVNEGMSVQTYLPNEAVEINKKIKVKPLAKLHNQPSIYSPHVPAKATVSEYDYLGYAVGDSSWIQIAMPHSSTIKVTRWVRKQDTTL